MDYYKPLAEMTREELKEIAEEKARCRSSFLYWLKYAKIIEAPTLDRLGGIIPLELWEHLKVVIAAYLTKRDISILKSRQIGLSYITAAYVLWYVMSLYGSIWMLFSAGEKEAFELLGKAYRLYRLLPPFLKLSQKPDSQEEMGFPVKASSLKAFPATESAGISFTASGVVSDEHEKHPFAAQNYISMKPTIETSGGQYISIFTVDKTKPQTLAKSLFRNGEIFVFDTTLSKLIPEKAGVWGTGNNGFTSLFFSFDVVPGRDEAWYESKKRSLTPEELEGLTPELYMESNYPRSLAEALSVPGTAVVFDRQVLNSMKDDTRSPINIVNWGDIDCEVCHIYKDYHIGNFYIAGTDVSLGVGKDYNVTVIMDVKSGDVVADIMSQYLAPEELALHSVQLLKHYHNPLWWIEQNLWGRTVIKKALELGYKRLGYKGDKKPNPPYTDADIGKFGFVTEEKSRRDLFGLLIPAVNDYQIRIYNQAGLEQFYGIIRNMELGKKGKIEAAGGKHDDYPMAVGIAWCKKDEVRTTAWDSTPIESLHFRRR